MSRPTMLSETLVARALDDPKFTAQVPEMGGFRLRSRTIPVKSPGCRSCHQAQIVVTVLREFIAAILALGPEPRMRVKRYFGTEALMLNIHNPTTNQVEVKII